MVARCLNSRGAERSVFEHALIGGIGSQDEVVCKPSAAVIKVVPGAGSQRPNLTG